MDELKLVYAYDRPREVGELFKEYTDMLIEGDSDFAEYLKIQKYDKELENPASKYGMPEGRLYLAYVGEELAGCVGLKKLDVDQLQREISHLDGDTGVQRISQHMNYGLYRVEGKQDCPRDALNICRLLGMDQEILQMVEKNYRL